MSWKLAHNLTVRVAIVKACYPAIVIGEVGDTSHQAEASDHNPDGNGIVHAIDVMTETNETRAKAVVAWCLAHPADLQYVIHDRRIWGRDNGGWSGAGQAYHGSDPHTNHVHISGKHGSTGRVSATGTGYDKAAEAMTPGGSPCASSLEDDMPSAADLWNADVIPNTAGDAKANPTTKAAFALGDVRSRLIVMESTLSGQAKTIAALSAALTTALSKGTSIDTAAVLAAITAVGKADSAAVTALQNQLAAAGAALAAGS